ncbi:MAG: discoidin domain-containing protein [Thermodesulfobacteriota bacterium]
MAESKQSPASVGSSPTDNATATPNAGQGDRVQSHPRKRSAFVRAILTTVYVLFLLGTVVAILAGVEYWAYRQIKNSPMGKAYQDRDIDMVRHSSQKVSPIFGYEPTPGFASIRNTRLGNAYEYINEQSFKDFEEVPLEKPEDEYRVFVTGGSVVFGRGPVPPTDAVADYYEVTYRWTIPHIIEQLLNADPRIREKIGGKHVRVINAGIAGHVIHHNLLRYLGKIRLYKPDLIISLDGANEVHTVARPLQDWNYFTEGPYYAVISDLLDLSGSGLANYLALWLKRNSYFFAWLAMRKGEAPGILIENVGFSALPRDPTPEEMAVLDRNIDQVTDTLAIYHRVLDTDRVPHVFALQPMLRNCKKKLTPIETEIERVTGMQKIGFYYAEDTYNRLVKRAKERGRDAGLDVMDLTAIFDPVNEWVFTDWCHLTNGANYILAKELTNQVKTRVFGLPLLPDDPLKQPLDSYFRDYAKTAKVLVNGKIADRGLHILKGYPGPESLQVPPGTAEKPAQIVLDLGESVPISRLRIVWGGPDSTPKAWAVEFSMDGKSWTDWVRENETKPDPFDQWPGFEYYAPKETQARYVRYTPLGKSSGKPIELRQISLFR